jgi:hypothetical protein
MASAATTTTTTTSASNAINSLAEIDTDIALLLSTASNAITTLTSPTISTTTSAEEEFTIQAKTYHSLLYSITTRLRQQISALQKAEIPVSGIDVGVLNSRNDVVGRGMEAECWAAARDFLEGSTAGVTVEAPTEASAGEKMEEEAIEKSGKDVDMVEGSGAKQDEVDLEMKDSTASDENENEKAEKLNLRPEAAEEAAEEAVKGDIMNILTSF